MGTLIYAFYLRNIGRVIYHHDNANVTSESFNFHIKNSIMYRETLAEIVYDYGIVIIA